ncbi:DUF4010 domain-containing protein [bacterium]|nr:DUF4010 domain-containing protein [bacterium]
MESLELTFQVRFFIALGLGFLLGLERETSGLAQQHQPIAGVRTYSLISMYGFGCAWLAQNGVPAVLPLGLISIVVLAGIEYAGRIREGHQGWTSSVAVLITYVIGALTLNTIIWLPLALGIISAILLSEKTRIEHFVESLKKFELFAILKFLVVTVLVLPLLPNREFTQFNLNPVGTWKIVILISTIGFVGYFLMKKFGSQYGLWLSGLLGGIVSSTAVSVAMGRMAQKSPEISAQALRSSLLASSVMYVRILLIIAIMGPGFLPLIWWRLLVLAGLGVVLSLTTGVRGGVSKSSLDSGLSNPFEISPALVFSVLFLTLQVVTILVKSHFGNSGLLILSFIVGVTDIDPFILSILSSKTISTVLVSAIIISMLGNTLIKGVYFGSLARTARRDAILRYGTLAVLHIPLVFL